MATETCLIICFYGDHHQVVKCGRIQKHPVTCFSQFDFSKMERRPPPSAKFSFVLWAISKGFCQLFAALRVFFFPSAVWATRTRREEMEGKAGEVRCGGGGESLDAEALACVWRLLERDGQGKRSRGCQPTLHKVGCHRQATGTYGCRPLAQPASHTLPSKSRAEHCQQSKVAIDGFPLNQTTL